MQTRRACFDFLTVNGLFLTGFFNVVAEIIVVIRKQSTWYLHLHSNYKVGGKLLPIFFSH